MHRKISFRGKLHRWFPKTFIEPDHGLWSFFGRSLSNGIRKQQIVEKEMDPTEIFMGRRHGARGSPRAFPAND